MKYLSFIAILLFANSSFAQDSDHSDHYSCGITEQTEAFFNAYPGQRAIAAQASAELEEFTRNYQESPYRDDVLKIIPVVFHVIHANGEENISNAQIESAIQVMNDDYKALNSGVNFVVSAFQGIIGNVNFEFRLARLDPDGNCTNGIVRIIDDETYTGGENLKAISPSWGRDSYLNIWVCSSIESGAAGYTYTPANVNGSFGALADGIVINHDYVGDMGTSNLNKSHALTHEVGHWANLPHTWGAGNSPGLPGNCSGDDGVSDTPLTIGWTTCNLQGESCGSLDNVENFMEYSYCSKMFTNGQKNRMRAAMNSSISQRNQLNTPANLAETGVLGENVICEANFTTSDERLVCPGQEISFEDLSFNGVTEWSWSFPGGTPATSNEPFPVVTYDTPGNHDVILTVSNSTGSQTVTKTSYIRVMPSGDNAVPYSEGFESFNNFSSNTENWSVVNPVGSSSNIQWEITSSAAYEGSKSAYVKGFFNTSGSSEYLQSPTYNLSELGENVVLKFRYAHARRNQNTNDQLRIMISRNCGLNWIQRLVIEGPDLPTVSGNFGGEFVPNSPSDWTEVEITNINPVFFTEDFRLRFEFTSNYSNNIYLDNINLYDPATVGLEGVDFVKSVEVFPNPATYKLNFHYNLNNGGNTSVDILDITGRLIVPVFKGYKPAGKQIVNADVSTLSPGIYFIRLRVGEGQIVKRFAVQH
ncbi:T9SS type A sorting domain-containing protein [Cryomorpha ignava]|uniref:T9SS type A sorting domain-containing protein n=1 Tax=Cryomorpha ignava TaxID=101383 RepID=A0A7K3WQE1_9FLAO|nr:M43 family zinc metalloprotease [Cryomorpha ignava]NEN23877.1 T9SS type A sorting domain-containing protein [Cryomorpha ignava]